MKKNCKNCRRGIGAKGSEDLCGHCVKSAEFVKVEVEKIKMQIEEERAKERLLYLELDVEKQKIRKTSALDKVIKMIAIINALAAGAMLGLNAGPLAAFWVIIIQTAVLTVYTKIQKL